MFVLHLLVLSTTLLSTVHGRLFHRELPFLNTSTTLWNTSTSNSSPRPSIVLSLPATAITSTIGTAPLSLSFTSTPPSPSIATPPFPIVGNGTGVSTNHGTAKPTVTFSNVTNVTEIKSNATSSNNTASCTINIPSASIDWWYAATYGFATATFTTLGANYSRGPGYVTTRANTATFDVNSALKDQAYTESLLYDPDFDVTWTYYDEYHVTPTAASTSVVSRPAPKTLPEDNIVRETEVYSYMTDLPAPASVAIGGVGNKTAFIATSTTPVLYFSAYEVEVAAPVAGIDSRITTVTSTETVNLPTPYAYPYWLKGIEDSATATGTVPSEFLQQIPQSLCDGGTLTATVTVLIVVDLYIVYPVNAAPFIVRLETSVTGFEDDPKVFVQETGKNSSPPLTLDIPMIMHTADGFETTTTSSYRAVVQPAVAQTTATPTNGLPQANNNPGQGPTAAEGTPRTIGTIASTPVVILPSSVVVVGSQTLTPGGPPITVGTVAVSLVPGGTAIVVGGTTSTIPPPPVPTVQVPPPILTIGSSTLTGNAATQFFIAPGQTLTPGGTATVAGTIVSLAPGASFIVIGDSTQALPTPGPVVTPRPAIVVGGSTIVATSGSTFVISGQTLVPNGQPITVDGITLSLASSGVVVNGVTSSLINVFPGAAPEIIIAGTTFTANPGSSFVINGQTLEPGRAITVEGRTISLAPSASFVVVNGVTSTFANPPPVLITAPPLTIGNGVYTVQPGPGTTYNIGGVQLTPGGVITVAGTTISLAPGATAIVVNGRTTLLNTPSTITNAPLLTVGQETFTAAPGTGTTFIIHGQTLTPGGTIVYDGTTVSLAPGATALIYGSSGRSTSTALFPATTTRGQAVTTASHASVGATGTDGAPRATNSKGAAADLWAPRFESCLLSIFIGLFSVI
ncbi:hypothetical protein B0J11DRAFT_248052 [Dendryphion nanum]|uniref:Uncharacterized protein n=1 Tax=Dendryphion nanum TaxID=256645 RepID=A0A9P9IPJ5_9PLEO|nr:hypothetical protein B0J11DRAFT_248052 [Dendryphion nanum]